jgi:hypothetical protein
MARLLIAALALTLSLPAAALAQEDDAPPNMLTISSYQCPQALVGEISENYGTYTRPIEQELVDEGMLVAAGMFFHAWSDEWNVNYWRVGSSLDAVIAAIAEVQSRFVERHPDLADAPGWFAECTAHKDNVYFWGPSTSSGEGG